MRKNMFVSRLRNFITQHPCWVVLTTLLWVIGLATGIVNLTFKSDYRVFFSQENPQLKAFEECQSEYNKSDNVLFVVDPLGGNILDAKVLQAIK